MLKKMILAIAAGAVLAGGEVVATAEPADAATASQRSKIVAEVKRHIGKGYRWGAAGPTRFDCSGLTLYVYKRATKKVLPHSANSQKNSPRVKSISRKNARAGDLVLFTSGSRAYHVGIYAGGNYMWDIGGSGKKVVKRKIWTSKVVFRTLR